MHLPNAQRTNEASPREEGGCKMVSDYGTHFRKSAEKTGSSPSALSTTEEEMDLNISMKNLR
jgi:hypothetical protein